MKGLDQGAHHLGNVGQILRLCEQGGNGWHKFILKWRTRF